MGQQKEKNLLYAPEVCSYGVRYFTKFENTSLKATDGSGAYDACTIYVEAKAEHIWDTEYTIDKKATCTTAGSKSIHCSHCDEIKDVQSIPATGHTKVIAKKIHW